jgi:hypothetical protein
VAPKENFFKKGFSSCEQTHFNKNYTEILNMVSKCSIRFQKGIILDLTSLKLRYKILKLYGESRPKFKQVSKNVPPPSDVAIVSFSWIINF